MGVHAGVRLALGGAQFARQLAGFNLPPDQRPLGLCLACHEPPRGGAYVGAIEVQADAARQPGHVLFRQACVGTGGAGGAAGKRGLDADSQHSGVDASRLWVRGKDTLDCEGGSCRRSTFICGR